MADNRGEWVIARKTFGVWNDIGTIYIPNMSMPIVRTSTQTKTKLADGGFGYIAPEVLSNNEALKMAWYYLPKTYKDQIDAYVAGLWDLRITDHNADVYYGRFIDVQATWLVGEDDRYDLMATFERMPDIA